MRLEQDCAARRFIAAPALHADVAVLDNVETADAVFAAKLVEPFENLERRAAHPVDRHRIALAELDGDDLCIGRRVFRIFRTAHDAVIRRPPRVLQAAAFIAYEPGSTYCRARVCQYGSISAEAVHVTK